MKYQYLVLIWRGEWQPLGYNDAPAAVLHDTPEEARDWAARFYLDDNPQAHIHITAVVVPPPLASRATS